MRPDRLDLVFASLPGAFLLLLPNSPRFTITGFNQGYPVAAKREPEELLGKNLFEVFPDNPEDPYASGVKNLSASLEYVVKFKKRHVMAIQKYDIPVGQGTGFEERYWQPENIPVLDKDGSLIYILHSVVDVTKEVAVYNSESDLKDLLNKSAIIIMWDDQKKIREVGPSACALLGYTREELIGMSLDDLKPKKERTSGDGTYLEDTSVWRLQRKDGGLVYVQLTTYNTRYNNENVNLAVGNDVTETVFLRRRIVEERDRAHSDMIEAVLAAQEEQRKQISLELHDNIIQILTTGKLFLERLVETDEDSLDAARTSRELVAKAIQELRVLSEALSPSALVDGLLRPAINSLIFDISALKSVTVNTSFEFNEDDLSPKIKTDIFRITQEQLSNIMKYANATLVSISIKHRDNFVFLSINDNGVGFELDGQPKGLGFRNMRSRCHIHGGRLEVHSSPGGGCHVLATMSTK